MAVMALSSEMVTTGKILGKAVGQEVLSFQRRDAPLEIQPRMHQQVRAWRIDKRDRDQGGGAGRSYRKDGGSRGPTGHK
jgi:hypothetical protein